MHIHNKLSVMKKMVMALLLSAVLGGAGYYYWFTHHPSIYVFNQERDLQPLLEVFKQHWYWLLEGNDHSPEFTFKYLSPHRNPHYFGQLKVNVLRTGNEFIGFVAYYMESVDLGRVLFLAIDNKFRRQKYGELLLRYSVEQLLQMGAKKIRLFVRTNNMPALGLYKRIGFYKLPIRAAEGFAYFEYDPLKDSSPKELVVS